MNSTRSTNWKQLWEQKSRGALSDFELDRGRPAVDREADNLAEQELLNFIEPKDYETVLDAGCGTGVNIERLHSRVRKIIGFDYALGSAERCKKRIHLYKIENAQAWMASVTNIPLPGSIVNKILCMSVLQYLNDMEARQALREFTRVLTPEGVIILHVKNRSSLYWLTLWCAKKLKSLVSASSRIEYVRPFQWYVNELKSLNCAILDYDSFNLLIVDVMPQRLVSLVRRFELRHHGAWLFRRLFFRRHGAELMIKARTPGRHPE